MSGRALASALLLSAAAAGAQEPSCPDGPPGVVVRKLSPDGVAAQAGLRVGDVLLGWERPGSALHGTFCLHYDLLEAAIEQPARGQLALRVKRDGGSQAIVLDGNDWGLEVEPAALRGALLERHREAQELYVHRDVDGALASWQQAAGDALASHQLELAAWLHGRAAIAAVDADRSEDAPKLLAQALAIADGLREPLPSAVRETYGKLALSRQRGGLAQGPLREAVERRRATSPGSLALAADLMTLGAVAWRYGERERGLGLLEEALALQERLAPDGLDLARTLHWLGRVHLRSDAPRAEAILTRALAILDRRAPETLDWVRVRTDLAYALALRGRPADARRLLERNVHVAHRLQPDGLNEAIALETLGNLSLPAGDLVAARDYFERTVAIYQRVDRGQSLAGGLANLGIVSRAQGDPERAADYLRRSESLFESFNPAHLDHGFVLSELGQIALERGDLPGAQANLERALEIQEKHVPGGAQTVEYLGLLGRVAQRSGDSAAAERFFQRGLALVATHPWYAPWEADLRLGVGDLALAEGRLADAEAQYRQARRAAADTGLPLYDVEIHQAQARLARRRGQLVAASEELALGLAALEQRLPRAGATGDARSAFAARYQDLYLDQLDVLARLGRHSEAFAVLERFRGRALRTLLAQRDLRRKELPPELAEERRRLDGRYDALLEAVGKAANAAEAQPLAADLREVRARQTDLAGRLALTVAGLPGTGEPRPLDERGVRSALDPGTLLLSYVVAERTQLFALDTTGPLSFHTLPLGRDALLARVEVFRQVLQGAGSAKDPALLEQGAALFEALMGPVRRRLVAAKRVLIVPDGPLHRLPFGALVVKDASQGARFLVEQEPVHTVVSASVYAELKRRRPAQPALPTLVAFGDPAYPALAADVKAGDPVVRDALQRGRLLTPLPGSRREVEDIAALFPDAHTYLGAEATEEQAKALDAGARYVHFACHGLLNEQSPLDSALALSVPADPQGRDNGLLQAWEIIEQLHLEAELVTLASCESGLGQERGGEGLIGLVRAFQYAGARSVLASLWGVSDVDTSALMRRFYGYLRDGRAKDEALRQAQVDLIQAGGAGARPAVWAPFQLIGDWR